MELPTEKIWAHLTGEADDAGFVARLRADGFPPRMVRLLVLLRLRERFAAQFDELAAKSANPPYWRSRPFGLDVDPETRARRRALEREINELAQTLLGPDAGRIPGDAGYEEQKRLFGDLPPQKIAAIEAIQRDYNNLESRVREAGSGLDLPEDREKLAYLERERRADIVRSLTPEELEQYDRRSSPAAMDVRSRLRNFDPTEDEFLKVYRLQRDFDERYGRDNLSGAEEDRRRAAQPELAAQIAAALGPERFADFQVFTDGNYSGTRSFVTSVGLPVETAKSLVTVQREVNRRAAELRADRSVPDDQRAAQLAALQKEADAKVSAIVGAERLDGYKRGAGNWLSRIVPPPNNPSR
jgi:hypothetical protein